MQLRLQRECSRIAPQSPSQQNPCPELSANDSRTHIQGYQLIFVEFSDKGKYVYVVKDTTVCEITKGPNKYNLSCWHSRERRYKDEKVVGFLKKASWSTSESGV
ncbi:hypothetical protein DPMN_030722 [Dreissena polymorpha]|uniref:Uncharacterized protein n=1 Tax=Dreissena polymorpha TaxID=45954 RepID=A0A9D4LYN6_DREPO|nr:hypothetical protein DPMN_030722 [Dreissena polymorpha]